jgi:hypothetical protein
MKTNFNEYIKETVVDRDERDKGYNFTQAFVAFVDDVAYEYPNQSCRKYLIDVFVKKEKTATIPLSFTEEIKDGRSSKFNFKPNLLLWKTFEYKGTKLKIESIKFVESYNQPSDYNTYVNYVYEMKISMTYENNF